MIPIAKPVIDDKEKQSILEVLDSGMLAAGEYVTKFEEEFASYNGNKYGLATSSGTTALDVAVKAAGIEAGDKVLTTPFTFVASSNSILYSDAEPVFVEIDSDSFNIDPEKIQEQLEKDPEIKALLIVHLFGLACDMAPIMKLVEKYDLILIEDCAQAHGAQYQEKKVGTFGDVSVFSFYPTKNMTSSEGGMVVTDSKDIMEKGRLLISHGSPERYHHTVLGYNYRMTNIEAAIGLCQLEKLNNFNQKRRNNADFLSTHLADIDEIKTPTFSEEFKSVFNLYTILVNNRDQFASYLGENNIGHGIYYSKPIYKQPLYQKLGYGNYQLEVTEAICEKVISLPVHPALSENELKQMVQVINEYN